MFRPMRADSSLYIFVVVFGPPALSLGSHVRHHVAVGRLVILEWARAQFAKRWKGEGSNPLGAGGDEN